MKKPGKTVTEAAKEIEKIADDWIVSKSRLSITTVTTGAARQQSKDPIFNLAAFLKYNFPNLSGESDGDWIDTANQIKKILGGRS